MQLATQETKRQPKDGRQTIAREIGLSKTGRGRQPKWHCRGCVSLLTTTYSGRREGSVITTALDGMGRCGLWSRPQRGQGEGKGAEEQNYNPFRLRSRVYYGRGCGGPITCVSLRPGTVLRDCACLTEHTLSPSVRLTRTATENRG